MISIGLAIVIIIMIILIYIFVVCIKRFSNYYMDTLDIRHPRTIYSKIHKSIKTGDIIFFINQTHGMSNSIFTRNLYTHSAMVIRFDDNLYISEAAIGKYICPETGEVTKLPPRAQLNSLESRCVEYPGMLFIMPLKNNLSEMQEDKLKKRIFEQMPYPGVSDIIKGIFSSRAGNNARHCMQHVSWLLDEIGLTPREYLSINKKLLDYGLFKTANELANITDKPLGVNGDNYYKEIYQLLYDKYDSHIL